MLKQFPFPTNTGVSLSGCSFTVYLLGALQTQESSSPAAPSLCIFLGHYKHRSLPLRLLRHCVSSWGTTNTGVSLSGCSVTVYLLGALQTQESPSPAAPSLCIFLGHYKHRSLPLWLLRHCVSSWGTTNTGVSLSGCSVTVYLLGALQTQESPSPAAPSLCIFLGHYKHRSLPLRLLLHCVSSWGTTNTGVSLSGCSFTVYLLGALQTQESPSPAAPSLCIFLGHYKHRSLPLRLLLHCVSSWGTTNTGVSLSGCSFTVYLLGALQTQESPSPAAPSLCIFLGHYKHRSLPLRLLRHCVSSWGTTNTGVSLSGCSVTVYLLGALQTQESPSPAAPSLCIFLGHYKHRSLPLRLLLHCVSSWGTTNTGVSLSGCSVTVYLLGALQTQESPSPAAPSLCIFLGHYKHRSLPLRLLLHCVSSWGTTNTGVSLSGCSFTVYLLGALQTQESPSPAAPSLCIFLGHYKHRSLPLRLLLHCVSSWGTTNTGVSLSGCSFTVYLLGALQTQESPSPAAPSLCIFLGHYKHRSLPLRLLLHCVSSWGTTNTGVSLSGCSVTVYLLGALQTQESPSPAAPSLCIFLGHYKHRSLPLRLLLHCVSSWGTTNTGVSLSGCSVTLYLLGALQTQASPSPAAPSLCIFLGHYKHRSLPLRLLLHYVSSWGTTNTGVSLSSCSVTVYLLGALQTQESPSPAAPSLSQANISYHHTITNFHCSSSNTSVVEPLVMLGRLIAFCSSNFV